MSSKYKKLSSQLSSLTNKLKVSDANLTKVQKKITTNFLINKEIPCKDEFQTLEKETKRILKSTTDIYNSVKTKK